MSIRPAPAALLLAALLAALPACASIGRDPGPGTDPGKLVIRVINSDARLSTLSIYLNQPPIRKVWLGVVRPGEERTFVHERRPSQTHFQLLAEGSRGMRRMRTIDGRSDGESSRHFVLTGPAVVEWDVRSGLRVITSDRRRGG